ncbi:glycosyltransferase family 4 protein [Winogradskyella ursingii]|uniref:glycosyltransferase family 4 protein n=1 Tax=Winogradskyella ursingii TaxID=2686079 RepID=UPI001C53C78F|nr:glycosyltransferase family 4 protein [Winogradskyella ursingii]
MIRAIQLIDSLEAGGAERLSVSLANVLSNEIDSSFICATRKEGILKETIDPSVAYLFLGKTSRFDLKALLKLKKFLKTNKINLIHAHSTSFFLATLMKILDPKIKLIWHDHYGESEFLENRPKVILKFCSRFFDHIFCVNHQLLQWSLEQLHCKNVSYLKNFISLSDSGKVTQLFGTEGKRILCMANLREQKNHLMLLNAFKGVLNKYPDWTLHCVGKDFNDEYAQLLKNYVKENSLKENVFFYGSRSDIKAILEQCEIGVLSSKSEGLPISLLEYGYGGLAVVVTDVGDCKMVIDNQEKGLMIKSGDTLGLQNAILNLIENIDLRRSVSENLHKSVIKTYSESAVIGEVLKIYRR